MTAYEAKQLVRKEQHRIDALVGTYLIANVFPAIKQQATKGLKTLGFHVEDAHGVEIDVFCDQLKLKLKELGYSVGSTQTFISVSW